MSGPLHGLRIFDLTRVLAGPTCTQILGDLGADVIKVEQPGKGDDTRRFAPPYLRDGAGGETGESAYFASSNRNKRSITLDFANSEGRDLAKRLIAKSDVLAENFKTGGLKKYGLGYEQLKDQFPGLVYCSITGFGQTGPYAERPGYDVLIQAMGGIMSTTGEPDGEPQKTAVPIADLMAGMYAAVSINAALRHREVTGQGQFIDIGMLDTQVATMSILGLNYLATGTPPPRLGNAHPNIVPYQSFPTADGNIIIAAANDEQFQRLCAFAGHPELAADEKFKTNAQRVRNRDELVPKLRQIIAEKPSKHWLDGLQANNVSSGPINDLEQVFNDPQVKARGMELEMPHPATGDAPARLIASPIRMSATNPDYRHAPPMLGQHTEEVLKELLDLGPDEIAGLRERGVI
ncbi:MAG: CoA transferase [Rhodospirillaceae bacterium]|jgi:crotonobetainyl-CoA:carnitine CoA-transferase CaiB-like acyl-CoA transferase|nr:CoA transferase [Rhodospirillaceae bacterium]|tara:strand:+ start:3301 stop:4518 length:1218 start_codon:yes stop_codon:yes gene_type:complete